MPNRIKIDFIFNLSLKLRDSQKNRVILNNAQSLVTGKHHRSLHDYFIIIISLSDLGLSPVI